MELFLLIILALLILLIKLIILLALLILLIHLRLRGFYVFPVDILEYEGYREYILHCLGKCTQSNSVTLTPWLRP